MNYRNSIIALLTAIAWPALAEPGSVVAGEIGYVPQIQPSIASRAAVLAEMQAWKRNPVTNDGWQQVGGQIGWEYVGTRTSTLTRQQVKNDAVLRARDFVTADGYRFTGGEAGWVYVGTRKISDATALQTRTAPR